MNERTITSGVTPLRQINDRSQRICLLPSLNEERNPVVKGAKVPTGVGTRREWCGFQLLGVELAANGPDGLRSG